MKILQVHNEYQHLSGEGVVVASEKKMLEKYGHEVVQWIPESSSIQKLSALSKAKVALDSLWSLPSYQYAKGMLREHKPDIVHVHNTIPLVSPSVYAACHEASVPVIHSLHNFKLVCPGAYLYRDGQVCEDCLGKTVPYPAMANSCYRNNRIQTTVASAGLTLNHLRGTYQNEVDIYIALTRFARQKFIQGGLPAHKIAVKPNFVSEDIQSGTHAGKYALFVGKLLQYKGIETVLRAWDMLDGEIPLKIVGQGPLEILLRGSLPSNVEYLGSLPRNKVLQLMQEATLVVFASEWYEGFPMTITEAFATGCPVVAARMGAASEIVKDGSSGWYFEPGDSHDLVKVMKEAWSNPQELLRRGGLARRQYDECYSIEKNHQITMSIYQSAIRWLKEKKVADIF
ncbi:MAG: glycosyltransferase family 4 protein [Myxacorys chilensis ATA2-1-KO14]|jgi:glycosyltransferase involved in cell wall biosynthesis|nr:glycosyltransferase family 4 protein [Myxacorys chilensis ATA2-1-KO14]